MRAVPSQIVVGKCHVHGFIKIACSTNTDVKSFNLTRITQNFQERFNMPLCTDSSNIMIIVCFSMIFCCAAHGTSSFSLPFVRARKWLLLALVRDKNSLAKWLVNPPADVT